MVIPSNGGHKGHHCSCNTDTNAHQSSLGPPQGNLVASITSLDQTPKESPVSSSVVPEACNSSFESLKRTLSSKDSRESLYALPNNQAIEIINDLEQGLWEHSGLCTYHRERFYMVLRKMCREHKLLPTSYTIASGLKRVGELPSVGGGNADVWRGVYHSSKVAIKVLRVHSGLDLINVERSFCREVVLWKQFRHPNLLPLMGATKSSHTFMMISEWMEHGTIMEFITACPDTNRLRLLGDVAHGLKYLHDWPSVHADLKSSNILVGSNFSARIVDFGLTSVLRNSSMSISVTAPTRGGTIRWMAPELFTDDQHPSKASDIYALGMVIYEVFAHEPPFSSVSTYRVPGLVFAGQRPPRPPNREILGLSDDVWVLAEKCWDGDSTVRPHIAEIFSFFEAASRRWVSSTPEAIADLGLCRSATIQKPETTESTFTASDVVRGG